MQHFTSNSLEGVKIPFSGQLVEKILDALRLKTAVKKKLKPDGIPNHILKRYFRGERLANEKAVEKIIDTAVEVLIPKSIALKSVFHGFSLDRNTPPTNLQDVIKFVIKDQCSSWDILASRLNFGAPPLNSTQVLSLPILRLPVLDLGIRWGTWLSIENISEPDASSLFENDALGKLIDQTRKRLNLTLEQFVERLQKNNGQVSLQSLNNWRSGKHLPTDKHIKALAGLISDAHQEDPTVSQLKLRLLVGILSLKRYFQPLCGDECLFDMLETMKKTAQHTAKFWKEKIPLALTSHERKKRHFHMFSMLLCGAESVVGQEILIKYLAHISVGNVEVQYDFLALPHHQKERIAQWMGDVAVYQSEIEYLKKEGREYQGRTSEDIARVIEEEFQAKLQMSNFDYPPKADLTNLRLKNSPKSKASNHWEQAKRATTIGDFDEAIFHLRHAIKHQPENSFYHFKLGGLLGQKTDFMNEGLFELYIAVQLDPKFGNARNEIAIILANMHRHEEAEQAYAEAAPYCHHQAHYWRGRGRNYIALGNYEKAKTCIEKAIEKNGDKPHIMAMVDLAAILMKLGETREAKRKGKKVYPLYGVNPTEVWEAYLKRIWNFSPSKHK